MPPVQSDLSAPRAAQPASGSRLRALLHVNHKARSGCIDIRSALQRLSEAGINVVDTHIQQPGELTKVIRAYRDRIDMVIIGGGDGTLSQAADGLVDVQVPLGILPLGTANDLARTLGIPIDPVAAVEVIAEGHRQQIDLGWVNGTHFFNVASIGLSAGVTRRINRGKKSRWGSLAYVFAAAQVVFRARPFAVEIQTETETLRVRTTQLLIGNGRHFGGGMTVDQEATLDDGLLHLVSLEVDHWSQLLPLLPALRCGTVAHSTRARVIQGREFHVRPLKNRPKQVLADGEWAGRTPATFRVVPQALSVFVPRPG